MPNIDNKELDKQLVLSFDEEKVIIEEGFVFLEELKKTAQLQRLKKEKKQEEQFITYTLDLDSNYFTDTNEFDVFDDIDD